MKIASTRTLMGALVCSALSALSVVPSYSAEMLPAEVSELVRDLGEWRKVSEGMIEETRRVVATNESLLTGINVQYIEASAAANSLIEQLQLELAARTPLDAKRYTTTVDRTKEKCRALTNECYRVMASVPKTRAASSSSSSSSSSSAASTLDYAAKSVSIADGLMNSLIKNRKAFRDMDAQQRVEVRNLLEERKWKLLATGKAVEKTAAVISEGSGSGGRSQTNRPVSSGAGGQ